MTKHAAPSNRYIEPTDDELPDPDLSDVEISGDNLLVRQFRPSTKLKTKSGFELFLPTKIEKDAAYLQNTARVLKVGRTAWKDPNVKPGEPRFPHGFYEEPWAKPGDWILYPRHSGQRIVLKGVQLLLIKDSHVLMKVKDPTDVDLMTSVLETSNDF